MQLVRQEVTLAEATENWKVDRSTIARIRTGAKESALEALANSRPGVRARAHCFETRGGPSRCRPSGRGAQGDGGLVDVGGGKRELGLRGRVPRRVGEATKAGLLGLVEEAVDDGWSFRAAGLCLALGEVRLAVGGTPRRRRARRPGAGRVADAGPAG